MLSRVSTTLENTSSTKLVMLGNMKYAPPEFIQWLKAKMNDKNLGIRETARLVDVSHPTISDIVTLGKKPSYEVTRKIAKAFGEKEIYLLQLADHLDPAPAKESPLGRLIGSRIEDLTEEEKGFVLDTVDTLRNRKNKGGNHATNEEGNDAPN